MEKLLRPKDVQRMSGLSRTTIWRLEQRGLFPLRRQLGARIVGWREEDVSAWLESLPTAPPKNVKQKDEQSKN